MFRIWPNFFCKKLVSNLEFNIITCFFLHFCYELKVLTTALKCFMLSISKSKRVLTGCSSGRTSRASLHAYSVLHTKQEVCAGNVGTHGSCVRSISLISRPIYGLTSRQSSTINRPFERTHEPCVPTCL